jgi:Kef-type K+ transport system membrane component KefB
MRLAIFVLILFVVLSDQLGIDLILGAFTAGAVVRAALPPRHHEAMSARLDGIGSAFLVPIFFVISGTRLDLVSLFSSPAVAGMIFVYALLMLVARGVPALLLYRADLSFRQRTALALHCGTQMPLVVAITSIAVHRGLMPGGQGAAMVGGGILSMILFPALAQRVLQEPATVAVRGTAAPGEAKP